MFLEKLQDSIPVLEKIVQFTTGDPEASQIALNELMHLELIASQPDKEWLKECDKNSVVMGLRFVLSNNLSLDPSSGLVYLMPRNVKIGNGWSKVVEVKPTANGILSMAYQAGKILDHKNPMCEYDKDGKVINCYFEILRPSHPQPRWEEYVFTEGDFKRWRAASHTQNSRGKDDAKTRDYSNPLYRNYNGGIDPEFAKTKAIKHSLKRLGKNPNEKLAKRKIEFKPFISSIEEIEEIQDLKLQESNLNELP